MIARLEVRGLGLPGRLEPTDFDLPAGELVGLIGPNGSGKTSLLRAIAGIGRPVGRVRIGGIDPLAISGAARARLFAYLPATRDIAWPVKARDLVALGGAKPEEVEQFLGRLDLLALAQRPADRLSTGERSRVLLARALASSPSLLLLDEPTANLDPYWQLRVMSLLRTEIQGTRRAAIVAIHDLDLAERYVDRVLLMEKGCLVENGEPASILKGQSAQGIFSIRKVDGRWEPLDLGASA